MFFTGVFFAIPAGYLEEIGWMGFAFEKLRARGTAFRAALILGLMWALWHLPVVDFLGVAHPHGTYWAPFFLAFGAGMTAVRVLIVWTYVNTGSLLAAQLLHVSSTGALVVLGATGVNAAEELAWYALYALALWLVVAVVVRTYGFTLVRSPGNSMAAQGRST
jgi:membrane protease YdiL (CAAX protease family)